MRIVYKRCIAANFGVPSWNLGGSAETENSVILDVFKAMPLITGAFRDATQRIGVNISILHGVMPPEESNCHKFQMNLFTCRYSNRAFPGRKSDSLRSWLHIMWESSDLMPGLRNTLYLKYWCILYKETSSVTAEVQ